MTVLILFFFWLICSSHWVKYIRIKLDIKGELILNLIVLTQSARSSEAVFRPLQPLGEQLPMFFFFWLSFQIDIEQMKFQGHFYLWLYDYWWSRTLKYIYFIGHSYFFFSEFSISLHWHNLQLRSRGLFVTESSCTSDSRVAVYAAVFTHTTFRKRKVKLRRGLTMHLLK